MTIVFDFETHPIGQRPDAYPPKPVGLAYRFEKQSPPQGFDKQGYLAWGHKDQKIASMAGKRAEAEKLLRSAFAGKFGECLFHNAPFDIEVAQKHFGVKWPKVWGDTLIVAFLHDPREAVLQLKPLATKYLDRAPKERDAVVDWVIANCKTSNGRKLTRTAAKALIWLAPADLVAKYAIADVSMTSALAKKLQPAMLGLGDRMHEAYARERALAPITMAMEQGGVRVDVPRLRAFKPRLEALYADLRMDIVKRLGGKRALGAEFNPSSGDQLGKALVKAGKLSRATLTATGKQSTAMGTLIETCADKKLVEVLHLYSVAEKYLGGFVDPWIESAERNKGFINPRFNQIRSSEAGYGGTRTGRFSSSDPNLQQVPADIAESKNSKILMRLSSLLVAYGAIGFCGLRDFFVPDAGALWVSLDYNQQELRILAHFEGGKLMREYLKNPALDVHTWIKEIIAELTGTDWPRKFIKTVVFGLLYGMGKGKLAVQLGITEEAADKLRSSVLDALPGLQELMWRTRGRITTWGGRVYDPEPKRWFGGSPDDEGKEISFEYKQLNTLIQGSAADCTKQGMIQMVQASPESRLALQVHDEVICMVSGMSEVKKLAKAMCDLEFVVPLTTKPKVSKQTWARCK